MVDIQKNEIEENEEISLVQKKATKLKIYIKSEGKTIINLPAISLKFLGMLGNVGFKLAIKMAQMDADKKDLEKVLEDLKEFDIREIVWELQKQKTFDLVYVKNEKDNTEIIIRTI